MLVRDTYAQKELTIEEAVHLVISQAPDYYAGELESLRAKLERANELLAKVIDQLPPEQAVKILGHSWEVV